MTTKHQCFHHRCQRFKQQLEEFDLEERQRLQQPGQKDLVLADHGRRCGQVVHSVRRMVADDEYLRVDRQVELGVL